MIDRKKIVGSWYLVSCEHRLLDSGKVKFPYGNDPIGRLNYSSDGRMIVILSSATRKSPRNPNIFDTTLEERASLAEEFLAYAGTYELGAKTVTHHVDACFFPKWVGTKQERHVKLVRNTLTLSTNPFSSKDGKVVATLTWKRLTKSSK